MFFENDSHFGRHLEFLGKLQRDSPGLLVCCSTDFSGPILKISACYEKCPPFMLLDYINLWCGAADPRGRHSEGPPLPGCGIIFGSLSYSFSISSTRRGLHENGTYISCLQ